MHTHTRPHVYTLVPTPLSEIEFTMGEVEFLSDETHSEWANVP